jgi:c-di-GMP-binding flagellar brake protein YcgR
MTSLLPVDLILPLAQAAPDDLMDIFRFSSDSEMTERFLIATACAIALSFILWFLNRSLPHWVRWVPGVRRRSHWEAVLRVRGLGPEERDLLCAIAKQARVGEIEEIVRSRVSFEHAVSRCQAWIDADHRRGQTLDRVRRRLSWESAPAPRPMQGIDLLEHNLEVEVFGVGDTAGYCARAVLVHRDGESIVLRLEKGLESVPWGPGKQVRIYFWRENDAGYLFDTPVIELRTLGDQFLFVAVPTHLERHQRRLHVRVPLRAPVTFLRVASGQAGSWLRGDPSADPGPLRGGVIEDLSAGGFRIRVTTPLQIGDFLSFDEFPVVEGEDVLARIISERREEGEEGHYYGAQFLGLSAVMRDLIAQHIFRVQRQSVIGGEWGAKPAERR